MDKVFFFEERSSFFGLWEQVHKEDDTFLICFKKSTFEQLKSVYQNVYFQDQFEVFKNGMYFLEDCSVDQIKDEVLGIIDKLASTNTQLFLPSKGKNEILIQLISRHFSQSFFIKAHKNYFKNETIYTDESCFNRALNYSIKNQQKILVISHSQFCLLRKFREIGHGNLIINLDFKLIDSSLYFANVKLAPAIKGHYDKVFILDEYEATKDLLLPWVKSSNFFILNKNLNCFKHSWKKWFIPWMKDIYVRMVL